MFLDSVSDIPAEKSSSSPPSYVFSDSEENRSPSPVPKQPTLIIMSYDRMTPPKPTPVLQYDLRGTPNPKKEIRDLHTGQSKGLRKTLREDPYFTEQLRRAEEEIYQAIDRLSTKGGIAGDLESHKKRDSVQQEARDIGVREDDAAPGVPHKDRDHLPDEGDFPPILRVGCLCGSGHHRSVAFAEELSRKTWPAGWIVKVEHRDLPGKVKDSKAEKRKAYKEIIGLTSV